MEFWQILLLICIPSILLIVIVYYLLDTFFKEERLKRQFELRKIASKDILPNKLNAYERVALFLERIKPSALAQRVSANTDAKSYELALIKNIQTEFDHNLSQQIYVNPDTWKIIHSTKNATMNFIKQCADSLPENATGQELQETVIKRSVNEQSPSSKAMLYLQKDIQGI